MTLRLIAMAVAVLAVLGGIWYFFVIPAQKKEHQRRVDLVQKKLEKLEERKQRDSSDDETEGDA